jgi:long-chain fatty acid transport protein
MATGIALGERLSVGAALTLGNSFLDGPFVDTGGMTPAYALRGTVGSNFQINCDTSLGAYWQSQKSFTFEDAAVFSGGGVFDVKLAHPENIGLGLANRSLMNGRLLLASDVLLKRYGEASFLQAIYTDQWVWQLGAQYSVNSRTKLRLGYAYNENPMRQDPLITSIGGVPLPDGVPALRYIQGQFAAVSQHRLTGGIGIRDFMPGIDIDMFAGGMFKNSDQFATTEADVESYWVGFGTTWRFGGASCDPCTAQ